MRAFFIANRSIQVVVYLLPHLVVVQNYQARKLHLNQVNEVVPTIMMFHSQEPGRAGGVMVVGLFGQEAKIRYALNVVVLE